MTSDELLEYETAVLWKIVLEGVGKEREYDKRIRRMLRRKGLGEYDQGRIDDLRKFKEDLSWELMERQNSRFYTGQMSKDNKAAPFDEDALVSHFGKEHPGVSEAGIRAFLPFAVYNYYSR